MLTVLMVSLNVLDKVFAIEPLVNATASLDTKVRLAPVLSALMDALDMEHVSRLTVFKLILETHTPCLGMPRRALDASVTLDSVDLTAPFKNAHLITIH